MSLEDIDGLNESNIVDGNTGHIEDTKKIVRGLKSIKVALDTKIVAWAANTSYVKDQVIATPTGRLAIVVQNFTSGNIYSGENLDVKTSNIDPITTDDSIIFAVVDEDGRRTWMEIGLDGLPTSYSVEKLGIAMSPKISEKIQEVSDIKSTNGALFAIVDEDGRKTDIELGFDGKLSQRSIDSIGSRIVVPTPAEPTEIIAPGVIDTVVGKTYRLQYSDIIGQKDASHNVLVNGVGNFGSYYQTTPTAAGTNNVTFTVADRTGITIKTKTISFVARAVPTSNSNRKHLSIGDSITRDNSYGNESIVFLGGSTVGTRTYDDGVKCSEGRGGWTLSGYFTRIGHFLSTAEGQTYGDSPFLFPSNVAGEKYWGNTLFWKAVVDPTVGQTYDFQGFQKIARNWTATGGANLYNSSTGYPMTPSEGDVVVDPLQTAGSTFRQYTSGSWVAMSPQPTVEFSFPKYMARFASAFASGRTPTSISFMLETNDFFNGITDADYLIWKQRLDILIASIRAWNSTVPIIICLAPVGGPLDKWGTQTRNKFDFDQAIRYANKKIIADYDTAAQKTNKVYISNFMGSIDPANMSDHVHPISPTGHTQMAPYLIGAITKSISDGAL